MTLRTHFDEGEYYGFYVLPIIDVFDRVIVNYHIGLNCTAQDAARTIQAAMFKRQIYNTDGLAIRSDNGSQFIITLKIVASGSALIMNEFHVVHLTRMHILSLSMPFLKMSV